MVKLTPRSVSATSSNTSSFTRSGSSKVLWVNVLQSVILTEDERMLLTPTYHVFHMYRGHQGAAGSY